MISVKQTTTHQIDITRINIHFSYNQTTSYFLHFPEDIIFADPPVARDHSNEHIASLVLERTAEAS